MQAQLQLALPMRASEALLLHVLSKQRESPSAAQNELLACSIVGSKHGWQA